VVERETVNPTAATRKLHQSLAWDEEDDSDTVRGRISAP